MTTMKVKSTNPKTQGEFVLIEEADFNPEVHEPFEGEPPKPRAHAGAVESAVESVKGAVAKMTAKSR